MWTSTKLQSLDETLNKVNEAVNKTNFFNNLQIITSETPKAGTGFSIGEGYIVTTADVLEGMKQPIAILDDGRRAATTIIGFDTEQNIGLLRLSAQVNVPALLFGNSDELVPGYFAISIGNQTGQANSVALNLIAGIRKQGTYAGSHFYPSLLQIAGTVGAGDSGAPVLNARGEVVGIMAAIPESNTIERWPLNVPLNGGEKNSSANHGASSRIFINPPYPGMGAGPAFSFVRSPVTSAGYAIAINSVRDIISDLRTGKPIVHGWIGVQLADKRTVTEVNGLETTMETVSVSNVLPDSPAAKATIQNGDILRVMNGQPVRTGAEVRTQIMRLKPGNDISIEIERGGSRHVLTLKVEPRPTVTAPRAKSQNR